MNKLKLYLKLFISTFSLSAFTFGGGYVIVPLMRKKYVDKLRWIEEEEMLDLICIAQSSPGAIAVNASVLVGYRLAGIPGALVTVFGTVLPPLIILTIISLFYSQFSDNIVVSRVLKGLQAGVVAVIADVVINLAGDVIRQRKYLPVIVMILAFIATYVFDINVILIMLICGVIGAVTTVITLKKCEVKNK